jgi:hypothetical protein
MKSIFTICVPDDCYLKAVNIVTMYSLENVNNEEEQKWLFSTNGKAKQVKQVIEDEEE